MTNCAKCGEKIRFWQRMMLVDDKPLHVGCRMDGTTTVLDMSFLPMINQRNLKKLLEEA